MAETADKKNMLHLKSRVFKRLFLSYAVLTLVFMGIYVGWYLYSYRAYTEQQAQETYQQQVTAWEMAMDQQFLTAQGLCVSVNASENCRNVFQTAYVEKKVIDSMQLYRLLNELTRIKALSNDMNIYTIMVGFLNDTKLYTPRNVLALSDKLQSLGKYPTVYYGSAAELLGVSTANSMILNKKYLIYADHYNGLSTSGPERGVILVLIEANGVHTMAEKLIPDASGFAAVMHGSTLFEKGNMDGRKFSARSVVDDRLEFVVSIPERCFVPPLPLQAMLPLLLIVLLGSLVLLVTYQLAKQYYRPIGSISQLVGETKPETGNEMENIIDGIRNLIVERNGYRERMVTISPYAQQGMLHAIINGAENQHLQVLINEQFEELSKPSYMVALVNIANVTPNELPVARYTDAGELIAKVCQELSTEEYGIMTTAKDLQNIYVIVSGEESPDMETLFYRLHSAMREALDDTALSLTMGVSCQETDLDRLQKACKGAERALACMLTGGRDSVYFDTAEDTQEERHYYFPKDALGRITKDLRDGNGQDLTDLLEELKQKNLVQAELSTRQLRLMVDELHYTVRNGLRDAFSTSPVHVAVERVREPATMEEIFSYYANVFATVMQEHLVREEEKESKNLEEEICAYIAQNIYSAELSQNGVADKFGVSSKMIGTICKNHYNTTFLQYVHECQIRHAAELLQTTDASLEQIAQQCGFTNLLTFRRNFKAVMNMNPSDFRK